MKIEPYVFKATIVTLIISAAGFMIFPPFYEEGIFKVLVPALSSVEFALVYALIKRKPWVMQLARPLAIGTLIVAIPFWGSSAPFYGRLAIPMLFVESVTIVSAAGLLALSYFKSFRANSPAG